MNAPIRIFKLLALLLTALTAAPALAAEALLQGTVLETQTAANYTYMKVKTAKDTRWIATSEVKVAVGDKVEFPEGMAMKDFHSQGLKRKFPEIYFVPQVLNAKSAGKSLEVRATTPDAIKIAPGSIEKASGGYTVAEIIEKKASLKGKNVLVRGKVVKVNRGIMGRNWIHVQDGTAHAGAQDLLVTSNQDANVGDVALFNGKVAVDRDFGAGYKYGVLLEEATKK